MINVEGLDLPNVALSNFDLERAASKLEIPRFRGVFVRDMLPSRPLAEECGILNTGDSDTGGFHWICWCKKRENIVTFDSYGLPPPVELVRYLKGNSHNEIWYNSDRVQHGETVFCGHLCLYVLKKLAGSSDLSRDLRSFINKMIAD